MKKKLLGLVAVLGLSVGFLAACGEEEPSGPTREAIALGEVVTFQDWDVVVHGYEIVTEIGEGTIVNIPSSGNVFVVVNVTVSNLDEENERNFMPLTAMPQNGDISARLGYGEESTSNVSLNRRNRDLFGAIIGEGATDIEGIVVFELSAADAENAESLEFRLVRSEIRGEDGSPTAVFTFDLR